MASTCCNQQQQAVIVGCPKHNVTYRLNNQFGSNLKTCITCQQDWKLLATTQVVIASNDEKPCEFDSNGYKRKAGEKRPRFSLSVRRKHRLANKPCHFCEKNYFGLTELLNHVQVCPVRVLYKAEPQCTSYAVTEDNHGSTGKCAYMSSVGLMRRHDKFMTMPKCKTVSSHIFATNGHSLSLTGTDDLLLHKVSVLVNTPQKMAQLLRQMIGTVVTMTNHGMIHEVTYPNDDDDREVEINFNMTQYGKHLTHTLKKFVKRSNVTSTFGNGYLQQLHGQLDSFAILYNLPDSSLPDIHYSSNKLSVANLFNNSGENNSDEGTSTKSLRRYSDRLTNVAIISPKKCTKYVHSYHFSAYFKPQKHRQRKVLEMKLSRASTRQLCRPCYIELCGVCYRHDRKL